MTLGFFIRNRTCLPRVVALVLLPAFCGLILAGPDARPSATSPTSRAADSPGPSGIAALPTHRHMEMSPAAFNALMASPGVTGRLLSGPALAAALAARGEADSCRYDSLARRVICPDAKGAVPRTDPEAKAAAAADTSREQRIVDSLNALNNPQRNPHRQARPDRSGVEEARTQGYFVDLFYDVRSGDWDWDWDEWAVVIYVVVGLVVVGVFLVYGLGAIWNLIVNKDDSPVFTEAGLRYAYSRRTISAGGPPLLRDAHLVGGRFAWGLDRGLMGVGLAAEGGYIDLSLRGISDPVRAFGFRGGYLTAGPLVRFGRNEPLAFTLEFLNGGSTHESIGWISHARMTLQGRLGPRPGQGVLWGVHLGAVFYELEFFDGLVLRQGSFNRDLSLVTGLDWGWAF